MDAKEMCDRIRETSYAIHLYHGSGYLEKVYENALVHRLGKAGSEVKQQEPIVVRDEDGTVVGEYFADVIVNNTVLVELKTCKTTTDEHRAQILHYLKSTGFEHGLLINFGSYRFEIQKFIHGNQSTT